jgi:hypothetical protein
MAVATDNGECVDVIACVRAWNHAWSDADDARVHLVSVVPEFPHRDENWPARAMNH